MEAQSFQLDLMALRKLCKVDLVIRIFVKLLFQFLEWISKLKFCLVMQLFLNIFIQNMKCHSWNHGWLHDETTLDRLQSMEAYHPEIEARQGRFTVWF